MKIDNNSRSTAEDINNDKLLSEWANAEGNSPSPVTTCFFEGQNEPSKQNSGSIFFGRNISQVKLELTVGYLVYKCSVQAIESPMKSV